MKQSTGTQYSQCRAGPFQVLALVYTDVFRRLEDTTAPRTLKQFRHACSECPFAKRQ